jgi:hypothetical protein
MDYPLDKLHQVRFLREQLAQSDFAQGRHRLDRADREVSRKQMHLDCHRLLQSKMQVRLFEEIGRKEVTLTEFESYRGRISDLRAEEKKCQESVRQAEILKDSASTEVDRLGAVLQKRLQESTKLKEIRNSWNAKVEEEKKWRMEEEMEEMVINRFSGKDAGS